MPSLVKWTKGVQTRMFKHAIQFGIEDWRDDFVYGAQWANSAIVVQFCKDPFGWVHMRGRAARANATPVAAETILTLPLLYRPSITTRIVCGSNQTALVGQTVLADILTTGVMEYRGRPDGGSAAGISCSMNNISFRAAVDG